MIPFKALYNSFATHKEASWILKPESAAKLYSVVKSLKPRRILELGTGVGLSTALCSAALKDAGVQGFEIHTVEQTKKCVDLAKELIPKELQEGVTFYLEEPKTWQTKDIPDQLFSIFASLPKGKFDLIIVDGPGPFMMKDRLLDLPNGDVIKMLREKRIAPGTIVFFDGRLTALNALQRFYSDNFYQINNPDNSRQTILERKKNDVKFRDERIDMYKKNGYFA